MALLEYFRKKEAPRGQKLPDPCGPLGQEVGKNLTEEANKEVALVLESSSGNGSTKQRRDPYLKPITAHTYHWSPDIFINMKTTNTRVIKLFQLNVSHFNSRARSAARWYTGIIIEAKTRKFSLHFDKIKWTAKVLYRWTFVVYGSHKVVKLTHGGKEWHLHSLTPDILATPQLG